MKFVRSAATKPVSPAWACFRPNQTAKMGASHTIPMMAPVPPASRFTRKSGNPPRAPSKRSAVTARVIRTGVRTSAQVEE